MKLIFIALAFHLLPACAQPAWPDTYVARLQALVMIQTLNVDLLASRSATLTLEHWCREHRLAENPVIVATLVTGEPKAATADQRQRLEVTPEEEIRYRHVRLRCGTVVLSEADNWYVPSRLTPEMNRMLETTDTPFGKVVQPLKPYRQTFLVQRLWQVLPDGWDHGAKATPTRNKALAIPEALFEHRAVLYTGDHKPFSEVDEVYQRQVLAFPPPKSRKN